MKSYLFLLLLMPGWLGAMDTLSIEQCRQLALEQHPLQQRKALSAQVAAQQLRNIQSNNLPRIQVAGQASYQSDVFGIPIDNPLFNIPEIPKDQYKITAEVSERIWDGGSDRYLRRQRQLENELADAQTEVDMFQVKNAVSDLFAQILLLQESEKVLGLTLSELDRRRTQSLALVEQGVALRTSADQVQVQILKTQQQRQSIQADRKSLIQVLAIWLGKDNTDFYLRPPANWNSASAAEQRPEYHLFALQQQQTQLAQDLLRLRHQPKIEAFAQGGYGSPNPFNMFETGFKPFGIIGVRAAWSPTDWGNTGRDKQVLMLQAQQINVQQTAFDRSRAANQARAQAEAAKYQEMLASDDALIQLQEDIIRRADAQVQNGVMTMTDYLSQVDLLTQARLTRQMHLIQAWQAMEKLTLL